MFSRSVCLFALLILVLTSCVTGMIQPMENVEVTPGVPLPYVTYMFSYDSRPEGSTQPYVSFDVTAQRGQTTSAMEGASGGILIYDARDWGLIGVDSEQYCCTLELKEAGRCGTAKIGDIIKSSSPSIYYANFSFGVNQQTVNLKGQVPVKSTGLWIFQVITCDEASGPLTLNGESAWVNPYGYLPADVYPLLPFYGILCLFYIATGLFFVVFMVRHRKVLLKIQWGILGVIGLGIFEVASWYFYRLGCNNVGRYSVPGLTVVIFINAVKEIGSRVLVLLVSMGIGTVKWTIGTTKSKLGLLALLSFFFAFLYQLNQELGYVTKQQMSQFNHPLILVPMAILESLFLYWIILSLIRTIQQLTLRRQLLKLDMYKKFFVVIAAAIGLGIMMGLYVSYVQVFTSGMEWYNEWIKEAYWEVLFYGIMTAIAILWRPRENNIRYSYAEFFDGGEDGKEVDDEHQIPLETLTVLGGGGEVTRKINRAREDDEGRPLPPEEEVKLKSGPISTSERLKKAEASMTAFERDIMAIELPSDDESEGGISIDTHFKKMD